LIGPSRTGRSSSSFDALPGLVFKVWIEREHLMCSRVPHGFTTPYCKTDVRRGGAYRLCMRSPEGREYWLQGVYREIVESEPIVFTCALENEELSHEALVTVTFAEHEGKTKLTMHQARFDLAKVRDGASEGWNESLDHFADYLAKA
jgi:uncharacterized protein YndB with AHSA1/START domain